MSFLKSNFLTVTSLLSLCKGHRVYTEPYGVHGITSYILLDAGSSDMGVCINNGLSDIQNGEMIYFPSSPPKNWAGSDYCWRPKGVVSNNKCYYFKYKSPWNYRFGDAACNSMSNRCYICRKNPVCPRIGGWCTHAGSTYLIRKHSNGQYYHLCYDGRWSGKIYPNALGTCSQTWPQADNQKWIEPAHSQMTVCPRPAGWCTHHGSTYTILTCNGKRYPHCSDTAGHRGTRYPGQFGGCKDTWPHGSTSCTFPAAKKVDNNIINSKSSAKTINVNKENDENTNWGSFIAGSHSDPENNDDNNGGVTSAKNNNDLHNNNNLDDLYAMKFANDISRDYYFKGYGLGLITMIIIIAVVGIILAFIKYINSNNNYKNKNVQYSKIDLTSSANENITDVDVKH